MTSVIFSLKFNLSVFKKRFAIYRSHPKPVEFKMLCRDNLVKFSRGWLDIHPPNIRVLAALSNLKQILHPYLN